MDNVSKKIQALYPTFRNTSNGTRNVMGTPKQSVRLLGKTSESFKRLGMPNTQPK